MKRKLKNNNAITLSALVVTIIILVILAVVAIAQIKGDGLFSKAEEAERRTTIAQRAEEKMLQEYEAELGLASVDTEKPEDTRVTNGKMISLINKDDGLYNKTEGGYIFAAPTSGKTWTSNNSITLTDSVENYDYIIFDTMLLRNGGTFSYYDSAFKAVREIKANYSNVGDYNKCCAIVNSTGPNWVRLLLYFKNENNCIVYETTGSATSLPKIKIVDIKGIKY